MLRIKGIVSPKGQILVTPHPNVFVENIVGVHCIFSLMSMVREGKRHARD